MKTVKKLLEDFRTSFSYMTYNSIGLAASNINQTNRNVWNKKSALQEYGDWINGIKDKDVRLDDIVASGDLNYNFGLVDYNDNTIKGVEESIGNFQLWHEKEDGPNHTEFIVYIQRNLFSESIYLDNGATMLLPQKIVNHNRRVINAGIKDFSGCWTWDEIKFESAKPYYLKFGADGFEL
ncbi:hypothetical protein JMN32_22435 [Fulvivirga sp. 29W222]|uniref:Uncharacterized protein n=1 Tax=Fulvivirga marina TaxID=2494733 RepID=A0A937KDF4_9BACT|nr:hypothetical protein [Fulvivirga marina]MBL6449086.1 hypothetical protein [Fulvivirga marina]